ncbi:MFS transporter [Pseudonocardia acaciae]|uniref:MFS transporter n=1 Tax=Pseudonocardia acaciae TaxID=551276 RepID=UPI000685CBCC|nr:MFS transporter [Pseudonocardia acaciae]
MDQYEGDVEVRTSPTRAAFASSVGTAVELYDFLIYGTASAVALNTVFFPKSDPRIGTLLAFASFGAGFFARPLGAIVIGHFGDRVGRRSMLVLTLVATGVCTALIGVLPGYGSIGVWAPALLVALRVVQGFFLGGEQGGAVLMAVEHAPPGRRGWYGSWTFLGSPIGLVLATGAFSLATWVSGPAFLDWGWRLPFLASLLLVGVGLYIRLRLDESREFQRMRERGTTAPGLPLVALLRTSWHNVLLSAGVNFGFNTFIFILATFTLSYATQSLGMARDVVLTGSLVGAVAHIAGILMFARLSDRVGRIPVMLGGAAFLAVYAFPLFWLMESRQPALVVLAMAVGYFGSAAVFGPLAALITELFGIDVRYSGASLGYQLGSVLGGGLSPFLAAALLAMAGGASWPISLYLVGAGLVSAVSLLLINAGGNGSARKLD